MPIYEYKCDTCDNRFEKLVFNQSTVINCPECDGDSVEKLFSSFGFTSSGSSNAMAGSSCSDCSSGSCSSCTSCSH